MTPRNRVATATLAALLLTAAAGAALAQTGLFDAERTHATPQMQQAFPDLF